MRPTTAPSGLVLLLLNLLAVAFYFSVAIRFDFIQHVPSFMFSTPDARGYKAVADWIVGEAPPPLAALPGVAGARPPLTVRPFLYPLLLGAIGRCFSGAGELYAIWFAQFVFWLLAINLAAVSVRRLTGRTLFLILAFVVLAANVSNIAITFHALTESTVFLLLSLWILIFSAHEESNVSDARLFILTPSVPMTVRQFPLGEIM